MVTIRLSRGAYFTYGFATAEYIEDSKSWSDTTAKVALTWTPNDDAMVFANYTQGFKSGGFGSFWIEDSQGNPPAYETGITQGDGYLPGSFRPEQDHSDELGFKTSYLDGAGNFDVVACMYDYKDAPHAAGQVAVANTLGSVFEWDNR